RGDARRSALRARGRARARDLPPALGRARDRAEDPGARPRRVDRGALPGPRRGGGPQRARPPGARAPAGGLMARPFSSDLSVAEAFVVREAGFTPIAQVMGSCFYQVGWQSMPWGQLGWTSSLSTGETSELETQTAAWNDARRLAVSRLRDEAVAAGADAVVGMRLRRGGYDWAAGLVEFVAIGTAVRSERYELEGAPVLSHLSGQDFAKLVRHGFWPVGLVAGSTVVYVVAGYGQQARSSGLFSGRQNQELPDYTRG